MNRRTEDMSLQLKFFNFDQLPEEEVQSIRNILNCPCSAVELPFDLDFQSACEEASYVTGRDDDDDYRAQQVEQHHLQQEQQQHHSDNAGVSYGVPVVPVVSSYPTHLQQPPMYAIANGNFLTTNPNQISHLFMMSPDMSPAGVVDEHGSMSPIKSSMDSNGPVVVSSSPYHHQFRMFHCSVPGHHSPQYVMSHMPPPPYILQPQQPPPPQTLACNQIAPIQSPSPPPSNEILVKPDYEDEPEDEQEQGEDEEEEEEEEEGARLEHVVVEVPGISNHQHPQQAWVPVPDHVHVQQTSDVEQPPPVVILAPTGHGEHEPEMFSFMCADQLLAKPTLPEPPLNVSVEVLEKSPPPLPAFPPPTLDRNSSVQDKPPSSGASNTSKTSRPNETFSVVQADSPTPVVASDPLNPVPPEDGLGHRHTKPPPPLAQQKVKKRCVPDAVQTNQAKSWASLFKSEASARNSTPPGPAPSTVHVPATVAAAAAPVSTNSDQSQQRNNAGDLHGHGRAPAEASSTIVTSSSRENATLATKSAHKGNAKRRETSKRRNASKANGAVEENQNRQDMFDLGRNLSDIVLDHRHTGYMIRGLNNRGNWCYINSILQALLVCNPLYNLMDSLRMCSAFGDMKTSSPIINSMVDFVKEFAMTLQHKTPEVQATSNKHEDPARLIGPPFEPTCVYDMLTHLKLNAFEGRQEDAEEFLSCLLNGLHEEMVKAVSVSSSDDAKANNDSENSAFANGSVEADPEHDSADEDGWNLIEPHNKSSVTRSTEFTSSPLADIFCGRIRSAVHSSSKSSPSVMLQPFFTLPLDVQSESVKTVANALHGFVMKESLLDYHCAKTKQEIAASRQMTLEKLPPVLILHLKRFVYCMDGGCMKVSKRVDFDVDLCLKKELLSPATRAKISENQRTYKLVAVVYHCGSEAVKGHYVTDVYHQGGNVWFRTDDSRVVCVPLSKVLNPPTHFVPYLFFYQRMDTVHQQQQQQQTKNK